jgi:hypothetical protein
MAKKGRKTDFTAQRERARYLEEHLAREWAKLRARKAQDPRHADKS